MYNVSISGRSRVVMFFLSWLCRPELNDFPGLFETRRSQGSVYNEPTEGFTWLGPSKSNKVE